MWDRPPLARFPGKGRGPALRFPADFPLPQGREAWVRTEPPQVQIRIIRSPRRVKTVSASLAGNVLEVRLPEGLTPREEQEWVVKMKDRVLRRTASRQLNSDADLKRRAEDLNRRYFGGRLRYDIRWVSNQKSRWGSCTPATRQIRISHELARMPRFVLDYVIVHELAHLVRADHSPEFWALVNRFDLAERAIGFLMGWSMAAGTESPCGLPTRPVPVDESGEG